MNNDLNKTATDLSDLIEGVCDKLESIKTGLTQNGQVGFTLVNSVNFKISQLQSTLKTMTGNIALNGGFYDPTQPDVGTGFQYVPMHTMDRFARRSKHDNPTRVDTHHVCVEESVDVEITDLKERLNLTEKYNSEKDINLKKLEVLEELKGKLELLNK